MPPYILDLDSGSEYELSSATTFSDDYNEPDDTVDTESNRTVTTKSVVDDTDFAAVDNPDAEKEGAATPLLRVPSGSRHEA